MVYLNLIFITKVCIFFYKLYTDLIFLLKDIEQVRNSLFCCQVDLYFKMEGILSRNKRF